MQFEHNSIDQTEIEQSTENKDTISKTTKNNWQNLLKDVFQNIKAENFTQLLKRIFNFFSFKKDKHYLNETNHQIKPSLGNIQGYLDFYNKNSYLDHTQENNNQKIPPDRMEKIIPSIHGLKSQILYEQNYIKQIQKNNNKVRLLINFHGATNKTPSEDFFAYNKTFEDRFNSIAIYPYGVIKNLKGKDIIEYINEAKKKTAETFGIDESRFHIACPLHSRSGITFLANEVVNNPEVKEFIKENNIPIIAIDPVAGSVNDYIDCINNNIPIGLIGGLIKNRNLINTLLHDPRLPSSGTYTLKRPDGTTYQVSALSQKHTPNDEVIAYELKGKIYIEMLNPNDGFTHTNAKKSAPFMLSKFI